MSKIKKKKFFPHKIVCTQLLFKFVHNILNHTTTLHIEWGPLAPKSDLETYELLIHFQNFITLVLHITELYMI